MHRADQLLAQSWLRACRRVVQTEGFLEDALAAALESAEFWPRFANYTGLMGKVPDGLPQVSTQDRVDEGRTDIILSWPNGYRLALELKTDDPPGAEQIEQYLRSGLDVAAVARLTADIAVKVGCRSRPACLIGRET